MKQQRLSNDCSIWLLYPTVLNMNELRETFIYIPYICGRAGKVKPIYSMKFINLLGFSARKEIVHNYFEFIKLLNVKACFKRQEGTSYSGKFQHFPDISSKILKSYFGGHKLKQAH